MLGCIVCGAAHASCPGPRIITEDDPMVTSLPHIHEDRTEPREMVRVQFNENDTRSYTRKEAEAMVAATPGAFIVGEQADGDDAPEQPAPKAKPAGKPRTAARPAPSTTTDSSSAGAE